MVMKKRLLLFLAAAGYQRTEKQQSKNEYNHNARQDIAGLIRLLCKYRSRLATNAGLWFKIRRYIQCFFICHPFACILFAFINYIQITELYFLPGLFEGILPDAFYFSFCLSPNSHFL
jgi:hypothetical protein